MTVELEQTLVITRTAFRGTLTLNNGLDGESLTEVRMEVDIRDLEGNPANDRFDLSTLDLVRLDSIDGNGTLGPAESGSAIWTIIPTRDAAPTGEVEYDFGATLEYTQGEESFIIPMPPKRLTVLPDPFLEVKYFWQRDVYADDPFTDDVIEPSEPFSLGLMITNNGAGTARNMRITSGQPMVYEDEDELGQGRGLLINFQLIGTQLGTEMISPSLTVDFGDLVSNRTAIARFLMISSLQGHFVDYEVSYEHVTGLGNPRLSLIDSVNVFELIQVVRAEDPEDDSLPDFLTNEWGFYPNPERPDEPTDPYEDEPGPEANPDRLDLPDHVHLSDGTVDFVTPVLDGVDFDLTGFEATVTVPAQPGWIYTKFEDPFDGRYRMLRVQRADGSDLVLGQSAWQTNRTFVDSGVPLVQKRIHIFDEGGRGPYTISFSPDGTAPTATWRVLAEHGTEEFNATLGLDVPPDHVFVEPRAAGIQTLIASFSEPIAPNSLNLVTIRGIDQSGGDIFIDPTTIQKTLSPNRMQAEITLDQPLPGNAKYCVRLIDVTDVAQNPLEDGAQLRITALAGDVTGDDRVNSTDVGALVSILDVNAIDPGNVYHVRSDVNQDGRVDQQDLDLVLEARGDDLRAVGNPCTRSDGGDPHDGDDLDALPVAGSRPNGTVRRANDPRTFIPEPELGGPR